MNKNIFPELIEVPLQSGIASYEKKCLFHERLLYQYLLRKMEGWSVINFLDEEEIKKYALYAVTDFTALFIKDIKRDNGIEPEIICDKNAKKHHQAALSLDRIIVSPEEMFHMYKNGKIKKIIVMSVLYENEIIDELVKIGVLLQDIISFVSVLYS